MNARRAAAAGVLLVLAWGVLVPAQRLPHTITPEHYDIHLAPDFSTDTFAGTVNIKVRLTEPTRSIALHAAEIEFHDATIATSAGTLTAAVELNAERETATLTVPQSLPAGTATIAIRYTGQLNDKLRGFYLSRANGRKYAVTQLEPTDARRAFPSFDEPAMKATFAVSTTIDAGDTAISNGRLLSDTPGPGASKHTLRFATTKRMSPYLVALLVGDWECISGSADAIPIRVCGTPDRKHELGFALETTEFALQYFNRYFSIKYPFEKLDIIGVPDFSAGAMENTGAIVFRDAFLLIPPGGGTTDQRKRVLQYIAHEIAHQWFGDLVTMQWWDDIWLNEGFATWLERLPMRESTPQWNARLDEVVDTQRAMAVDMLKTTRPVRTHVETTTEINQVFDSIAYQKTAAIIRMIEGYVGPAAYRNGMNAYLKKFAFGNATAEGLWTTLAASTGRPVDRIMSGFMTHAGVPLVEVATSCAQGKTQVTFSQRPLASAVPDSTVWNIPICYKRGTGNGRGAGEACTLLSQKNATVTLDGCTPWLFANDDGRGYYRTGYTAESMQALHTAVRNKQLTAVEETVLLEDLWALVWLNDRSIADFLSLSTELLADESHPAAATALARMNTIADSLVVDSERPAFQQWVRRTLGPAAKRLGWSSASKESEDRRRLREAVIYTLGYAGRDAAVLRDARRLVEQHLSGTPALDSDMAETAVELAALTGDAPLHEQYVSAMNDARSRGEQMMFRNGLAFFSDPALQKRTIELATSSDVRAHDAPEIISRLMRRPSATAETWTHLKANWDGLQRSMGIFQALPDVVDSTENFCDAQSRADVEQFFRSHPVPGTERTLAQALETIERCAVAKAGQARHLTEFLRN
jgi:aminopeptidase N